MTVVCHINQYVITNIFTHTYLLEQYSTYYLDNLTNADS